MDTVGCASEIVKLNIEIKNLSAELKLKRDRISKLKSSLDIWLDKMGKNEVKHNDQVIYRTTKPRPSKLTKQEKEKNAILYLQSIGISDCKYVLEKLKEVQQGDEEEITNIQVDDEKTYETKMKRKTKSRNKKRSSRNKN